MAKTKKLQVGRAKLTVEPKKKTSTISPKRLILDLLDTLRLDAVIEDERDIPGQNEEVNPRLTRLSDKKLTQLHRSRMCEFGDALAEAALQESDVISPCQLEGTMILIHLDGYEMFLKDMVEETKQELDRRKKLEHEKPV